MTNRSSKPKDHLPQEFITWADKHFGEDHEKFIASLESPPVISVRRNPGKTDQLVFTGEKVPWCEEGLYLEKRPNFARDPWWHGGAYYVQDASSMVISKVIQQCPLPENPVILDMCGAPGGKATLAIDQLPEDAILVANEVIRHRFPVLLQNLIRWGDARTFATQLDPSYFKRSNSFFDLILVDAPCSGEGLFRKDPAAAEHWSLENVNHCCLRQQRILSDTDQCLKKGGYLIYSTCTYNENENFGSLNKLIKSGGYESVSVVLDPSWGVTEIIKDGITGYACYPHKMRGEGLFFTLLKKNGSEPSRRIREKTKLKKTDKWPDEFLPDGDGYTFEKDNEFIFMKNASINAFEKLVTLEDKLRHVATLGKIKGHDPIPDHALAQARNTSSLPSIELDQKTAVAYLKKDPISLENSSPGWSRVSYNGIGLGWIKVLKNRINNYYPSEYRLRK